MPQVKVNIHFVWSTKGRYPFLDSYELRKRVFQHIWENARSKGIYIDFVSGYADHCHALVSLGVNQTMQKIIQLIKGESSYWINKNGLTRSKFGWQDEYYAVSVSPSLLEQTREYIKDQEQHHKKSTFQEEYEELLEKYEFEVFKD